MHLNKSILPPRIFLSYDHEHRAAPRPPLQQCRGGSTPYLGPYLATCARLLGKGLPGIPGLPGALPCLPGPYLAVEHCTLPSLTCPPLKLWSGVPKLLASTILGTLLTVAILVVVGADPSSPPLDSAASTPPNIVAIEPRTDTLALRTNAMGRKPAQCFHNRLHPLNNRNAGNSI